MIDRQSRRVPSHICRKRIYTCRWVRATACLTRTQRRCSFAAAEARVFELELLGRPAIAKQRFRKTYRLAAREMVVSGQQELERAPFLPRPASNA
jgi:hypothetical protein